MKSKKSFLTLLCLLSLPLLAQDISYKFNFVPRRSKVGYLNVTHKTLYGKFDYGYDFGTAPEEFPAEKPFYFSVNLPDGNYRITVELGNAKAATETTIRGESRRLFFERVSTEKGEFVTKTFTINKRNKYFDNDSVRIKPREMSKLNWDDKLTLEFNGSAPAVHSIEIQKIDDAVTVYLCGNSTVVDQDNEPWASWGQMIPRFFNEEVSFANYAESGESSNTFIGAKRLAKILTRIKPGDYIFVEFGHNDEKQKGEDKGAYKHFTKSLKTYIDEARRRGATPVLVTPTQRRNFDKEGNLVETHGEFPQAVRDLAAQENVPVIDLTSMTTDFYLALGVEASKRALVHYPAGSYPGQTNDFADNTHFNPYGAYEISKCVIEGMIQNNIDLIKYLRCDYPKGYNPKKPIAPDAFKWEESPFSEVEKPDGN